SRIHRLGWPAAEVGRDLFGSAFELAIVKKPQAWTQKGQNRSRAMNTRRKCGGCSWFVMIFQKTCRLLLEISVRQKMFTHRPRVLVAKTVIEPLVVGKIEALLLECPFQVPINLCHDEEVPSL